MCNCPANCELNNEIAKDVNIVHCGSSESKLDPWSNFEGITVHTEIKCGGENFYALETVRQIITHNLISINRFSIASGSIDDSYIYDYRFTTLRWENG